MAGPLRPAEAVGPPAWPSHASTDSGFSPGRTTIRTFTRPSVAVPGRTFHVGSYGPTQSTSGKNEALWRSRGRPRTTNPSCGTYRRSASPRDASSPCHSALIGPTKWTTPTVIPRKSTDHETGDASAVTSTRPAANRSADARAIGSSYRPWDRRTARVLSEPCATANAPYDASSWAPAVLSSASVASVRNVVGLPTGTEIADIDPRCVSEDGSWTTRISATANVTKTRKTRLAVWPSLPWGVQAADLYLRIVGCDAAQIRLLAQIRIAQATAASLLRDDPRRLQDPTLEDECVVVRRMVRAAQFHAPNPSLDVRVVDAFHLRVDDPVAEIFLAVLAEVLAARFHLADQDRRRLQIADPLEQLKEIFARVFKPRHDLEDRERIDDEDVVVEGPLQVQRVHLEDFEPGAVGHAVQVATEHTEVHDADLALDIPRTQAHLVQVAREVLAALLQGDVRARPPVSKRVLIHHVERDRGLHRPRLSREQDDVALRDAAPELVIKTVDERADTVSLAHSKAFHWKERV